MYVCTCLPPSVHHSAAAIPHHIVVPQPRLVIQGLPHYEDCKWVPYYIHLYIQWQYSIMQVIMYSIRKFVMFSMTKWDQLHISISINLPVHVRTYIYIYTCKRMCRHQ